MLESYLESFKEGRSRKGGKGAERLESYLESFKVVFPCRCLFSCVLLESYLESFKESLSDLPPEMVNS